MAAQVAGGADAADRAINALRNCMKLYDKQVDRVIPWETFQKAIEQLRKGKSDMSRRAGELVGKINTLILDSQDHYKAAVQSVFEWCQVAARLLEEYLNLFDTPGYGEAQGEAQRQVLIVVLAQGEDKMKAAQEKLRESTLSFNKADGELVTLGHVLKEEYDSGSSWFQGKVDQLRKEAYGGAAAGVVFGPIGLVVSYSIAAGVTEGELIPKLAKELEAVRAEFEQLQGMVAKAHTDIGEAKSSLQGEIRQIGNLKAQVVATRTWVMVGAASMHKIKEDGRKLIGMCEAYVQRHGG